MLKFVILIAGCALYVSGETANYCDPKLCPPGKKHIACGNNGDFSLSCSKDRVLINIEPYRQLILQKHNECRNKIAGGNLPGFESASRMATMMWDNELANLACLNVKQCKMKHDACRNTDQYQFSGQNLAWRWGRPPPTDKDAITRGIDEWFNEYKDANMDYINKYKLSSKDNGHFTAMSNDINCRAGCCLLKQSKNEGVEYFFACNYAMTNVLDYPIYISGVAASKCTTGTNKLFKFLCSRREPIDANNIWRS